MLSLLTNITSIFLSFITFPLTLVFVPHLDLGRLTDSTGNSGWLAAIAVFVIFV